MVSMASAIRLVHMLSVGFGTAGLLLAVLALWFRTGTSRAARWWFRTEDRPSRKAAESVALLLVPYFAQFALAVAIAALPVFHEVFAAAVLLVEFIAGAIFVSPLRYRRLLPLWLYPAWLRPEREREQDELRRLREF